MRNDKEQNIPAAAAVVHGLGAAFILTAAVFLLTAAVMTMGSPDIGSINKTVYITSFVSVLAGGLSAALQLKKRGLAAGTAVAVFYTLTTLMTGYMLLPDFVPGIKTLAVLASSAAGGAAGGIAGVNLASRKRRKK